MLSSFLLALTLAAVPPPGEVVLLSGQGRACPREHLGSAAVALLLDGAALPAALQDATRLELDSQGPGPDRDALRGLTRAPALHLVGGTGIAWWRVLTTRGKRSPLQRALLDARARGAALVGWGAGAQTLAGAYLAPTAQLEAAGFREHNPRRVGELERPVPGLGLVPGGLALLEGEGALERLLGVLHRRHLRQAILLEGEVAWRWDARGQVATLTGEGQLLLLELDGARRTKTALLALRSTRLVPGDRWELEHDRFLLLGEGEVRTPTDVRGLPRWPPGVRTR